VAAEQGQRLLARAHLGHQSREDADVMRQQDDGIPVAEPSARKERIMSSPNSVASDAPPTNRAPGIQRLLFVSDAAVADVHELPPVVRAIIDTATEVNVLTPTLPGRLAWLADDVDRFRHYADERLDTVLSHMHAIGADAGGIARRGSVLTVIADAVTAFEPDHILIALHVSAHANWQEHRLVEHVENRFRLPLTTFAVDPAGNTRAADGPLLLYYDGSEHAKHAIEHAGRVLGGRTALVVTVWQPTPALGSSAPAGATDNPLDFVDVERAAADLGERVARDGVHIAQQAGLHAKPVAVEATGPVWKTIVEIADRHDAATIVMGSRGLTHRRPALHASVPSAIVHHAHRPTLIIPQPTQQTGGFPQSA
jgi:nucleotide-binding universal stress UspA family protein